MTSDYHLSFGLSIHSHKHLINFLAPAECFYLQAPVKYSSKSSECDAMEKCKGKKCSCVGNTCEHQCNKTKDCQTKEHWCFIEDRYYCK